MCSDSISSPSSPLQELMRSESACGAELAMTPTLPTHSPSFRILWWDHGLLWTIMLAHMLDSLVRVSRRVDWGPLLPRASWTCQSSSATKETSIQAWRVRYSFISQTRTTTIWELTTNMKAWSPLAWELPPKQKKTRFSTFTINPNNTAVAPNDLPNGERMPCGHTFHFLSLSDSKNVRTGVTPRRETKELLQITHESCPVNKIDDILRKTDAGSPNTTKVHPFVKSQINKPSTWPWRQWHQRVWRPWCHQNHTDNLLPSTRMSWIYCEVCCKIKRSWTNRNLKRFSLNNFKYF